jgi:tRNA threonylcarbamoyladenosine biosynthesis protein TsaE
MRADLRAPTPDDTRAIGRAVASLLRAGDVVALGGELGAGKTTLVQGAAAALGVAEPVLSPTFTLVREYRGSLPIYHLDVYRLNRLQDVLDLGFEEMTDAGGVTFVEWGDVIESLLPESHLEIALRTPEQIGGNEERWITVDAEGPTWTELHAVRLNDDQLLGNYQAILEELIRAKPSAAKGRYLRAITLSTTMSPGIKVDPARTRDLVEEEAEAPAAA